MTITTHATAANNPGGAQNVVDVRDALDVALKDKSINSTASFSFSQTYPEAPNPALSLADIGLVGLPLSIRDAELVKTRCVQAPFGMGERTIVDKTVRDTWEMDAKQVSFLNPRWNTFVSQALTQVCQTLGVNFHASQPRAELYKLLLYETGSHFLPHVDTEKANGMFATIVIVLPSHFAGGAAHLSHGELSTVYDCSTNSQHDTTVLAWYTDVKHEIKPITSGYRLALSYNLIHTTNSLRPALSANTALVEKLSRVLLTWNDDKNNHTPGKLVYLLDHKYSEANLRASALKGADAQKVAILEMLAKRHGFGLGLANAHCHLTGSADDDGGGYYERRRDCYHDEPSDNEDVDFLEVYERDMTIEHFVDLDGDLISSTLDYDKVRETIPRDLTRSVEAGEHDEQEYEGYMGCWIS
ncbi:hypothetical protein PHLGIDRAFT_469915 [Phlebiopsis gigantea 11061_1 CR5-6]|uniref:Uncharacterized protein n=1 Tax=Phlebiopsis gigantea (strain 11061_1 CR5-6) TaxID=745531 RepID=A0A0C3NM85_PHLG1|nr:hypothetical protein PHLGIDRAFT_469915 [Phlebiopsis gigantea 11061_1 CR5-6]